MDGSRSNKCLPEFFFSSFFLLYLNTCLWLVEHGMFHWIVTIKINFLGIFLFFFSFNSLELFSDIFLYFLLVQNINFVARNTFYLDDTKRYRYSKNNRFCRYTISLVTKNDNFWLCTKVSSVIPLNQIRYCAKL